MGPHDGSGGLEEDHRFCRQFRSRLCGVIAVVEADTDDLAGAANGGAQPNIIRHSGSSGAIPFDPGGES